MTATDGAGTLAKGLRVIACFTPANADMTMADIARHTGFDRATTRRLCLTLENEGYIDRDGRKFRLAPKVMTLAGHYLSTHEIGKSVQPVLNHFAEHLNGEINLAVRDGPRAIFVARSAVSTARLSLGFSVGSTLPLLPTAVGRMLLARCPLEVREALLTSENNHKFTAKTDTDLISLGQKITQAARDEYAHVVDEFELGATGLAVPVGHIGGREAVLGTTTSSNQLTQGDAFDRTLDALRCAALSLRA